MLRKMMLMRSTPKLIGAEEFVITPDYSNSIVTLIGFQQVIGQIGNLVPKDYQGYTITLLGCGCEELGYHQTSLWFANDESTPTYASFLIQRTDTLTTLKLELEYDPYPMWTNPIDLFSMDDVGKEIHLLIRGE